jgi:hypothetical protein
VAAQLGPHDRRSARDALDVRRGQAEPFWRPVLLSDQGRPGGRSGGRKNQNEHAGQQPDGDEEPPQERARRCVLGYAL